MFLLPGILPRAEEDTMEVQTISNMSFAVYLDSRDLSEHHIKPDGITSEDTAAILRTAFQKLGRTFCSKAYVDFFPGRDEVMLFVRLNFKDPLFFRFEDFESVITAAAACGDVPFSSLFYIDGHYVLAVYRLEGEPDPISLFEFGAQLEYPADFALHLSEHGRELILNNAISVLREKFSSVSR